MAYTSNYIHEIDKTKPFGTEAPSVLDDSIREVKRAFVNAFNPPSPSVADHALSGTAKSIASFVTAASGNKVEITLFPGTYNFLSDYTIPANVTLRIMNGAQIVVGTSKTLTVAGKILAQDASNIFGTTGTITFSNDAVASPIFVRWFSESDLGAKFNRAFDTAAAKSKLMAGGDIWTSTAIYSTQIVLNKQLDVYFSVQGKPIYRGTGSGLKVGYGASGSIITNFSTIHDASTPADTDGLILYATNNVHFMGYTHIDDPVRHGIVLDGGNVLDGYSGCYNNVFLGEVRITAGGGDCLLFTRTGGTGTALPNANYFAKVVQGGYIKTGKAGVHFERGYYNVIDNLYINGNELDGIGIYSERDANTVGSVWFDGTPVNEAPSLIPVKTLAGGHVTILNRGDNDNCKDDVLGNPSDIWYVKPYDRQAMPFANFLPAQDNFWGAAYPVIYATKIREGASAPFDAASNLVFEVNTNKEAYFCSGDVPCWKMTSTGQFETLKKHVHSQATLASATTISPVTDHAYITGTTTIDSITALNGHELTLIFASAGCTVSQKPTIQLDGGVDFVSTGGAVLKLVCYGGTWYEISRSMN